MNEQDFLEVIRNDPHDLTARLVYADWLDEQGDPQGEFIRVQCELAGLPLSDKQRLRPDLVQKEAELLEKWGVVWSANYLNVPTRVLRGARLEFFKGLPELLVDAYYDSPGALIGAGNYDYVSYDFREYSQSGLLDEAGLPVSCDDCIRVKGCLLILYPNVRLRRDRAIQFFNRLNLLSATWQELCVIGAHFPDLQHLFCINTLTDSIVDSMGNQNGGNLDYSGVLGRALVNGSTYPWYNSSSRYLVVKK